MSNRSKLLLLRIAAFAVLLMFITFLDSQPEEKVWWFWLAPAAGVYLLYRVVLSLQRCSNCREPFALEPVDQAAFEQVRMPQRMLFRCSFCGNEEYKWVNGPSTGGGGGP